MRTHPPEMVASLRQIVDAADALFHVLPIRDADGAIRDMRVDAVNPAAEVLLGARSLDSGTVGTIEGFTDATRIALQAVVLEVLAAGRPVTTERRFAMPNGDRWWEFRVRPMAEGVLVTAVDATARQEAETATQDRFRLIAENATDVILLVDASGVYTWASPSVKDICGWWPHQLVGHSFEEFVHPDDLARVVENRRRTTSEVTGIDAMRYRCGNGDYLWMSSTTRSFVDSTGSPKARVVALRDIQHQVEAQTELARSEARYRMLAENASDAIYQVDLDGAVQWVSPSIEDLLGWRPDEFMAIHPPDLMHPDDRERVIADRDAVRGGAGQRSTEARVRCANGDFRWVSVQGRPFVGEAGDIVAVVVALRDCETEVVAQRARATLSAATGILLHADNEEALLSNMCQAAVDVGGYLLAWYGRAVHDAAKSIAPVAASRENASYLDEVRVSWGADDELGRGPGGTSLRERRTVIVHDAQRAVSFHPWAATALAHGFRSSISLPVSVDGVIDGAFIVYAAEPFAFGEEAVATLTDLAGQLGYGLQRLRDQQLLTAAMKEQTLLIAAVEQAAESVVITDTTASILYANPAALRVSGYSLDELAGKNPRVFQSGLHDVAFYEAMWAQLTSGRSWRGVMMNRRKNGDIYEEDVTITPIHDAAGDRVAFVGTKRDLTELRQIEADLQVRQDDRELMLMVMARVRAKASLAATTEALCEAIADLPTVDLAAVLVAGPGESFHVVGFAGDAVPHGVHMMSIHVADPVELVAQLDARARSLDLADADAVAILGAAQLELLRNVGFTALAVGAIRSNGEVIGLLVVGTRSSEGPEMMRTRRQVIEELGSFAGTLLAPQMDEDNRTESIRAELGELISNHHFHPVYQPIVDLATRQVCGYEALTRFTDGTRPDVLFSMAHAVGMGSEMEIACARDALEGARDLPADVWLSINFSPLSVTSGTAPALLAQYPAQRIVLEITEHAKIDDYVALRQSLRDLAPAKVSIDDTGAGFASLRHILELKPDFVKLDIALVRDIDSDPARQALTVGLCHFAARTGAVLIAEGVETDAEAHTLRELGVPFGQGYLFGRPAPLA
ncbi:MAG: PAS domain S-box protein [Actinomycetota bacterium]|nr:PAS domain S-box protein [Actinomycetota bacterium]